MSSLPGEVTDRERKAVSRLAFTVAQRKTPAKAATRTVVWGQSEIVVW